MKYLILAATALIGLACSSQSQTIKSLGYDTTNGRVIYSGTNALTFTNSLQFATNARAATRTNLGGTSVGNSVFTATNAAAAATAIGLGTTNYVGFYGLEILGAELQINGASIDSVEFGGKLDFEERRFSDGVSTVFEYSTNSFAVTPNATFETNVTINGNATLNGVGNIAPHQTAISADSLMTRSLGDTRYLPSFGEYMDGTFYRQTMADWMPTRVTNGGSATFDATGSRWNLNSATNVGNLVGLRMGRMEGVTHSSGAGANSMWSSGFSAFVFTAAWSRSNQVLRFVVGHSTGDPIGQYPTNRAVGIEFSGDGVLSARLIAHNGTTATNGPLVTGLRNVPYACYDLYAVRYYTNGTVELYQSVSRGAFTNIPAATITGGPTNNALISTAGAVDLAFDSGTNATSASAGVRPQWWGYQYHD